MCMGSTCSRSEACCSRADPPVSREMLRMRTRRPARPLSWRSSSLPLVEFSVRARSSCSSREFSWSALSSASCILLICASYSSTRLPASACRKRWPATSVQNITGATDEQSNQVTGICMYIGTRDTDNGMNVRKKPPRSVYSTNPGLGCCVIIILKVPLTQWQLKRRAFSRQEESHRLRQEARGERTAFQRRTPMSFSATWAPQAASAAARSALSAARRSTSHSSPPSLELSRVSPVPPLWRLIRPASVLLASETQSSAEASRDLQMQVKDQATSRPILNVQATLSALASVL